VAMGPDQQRLTPDERSVLVAYLDGELDEAESRAIATKLARSATARREVESLEKTWDLLDHLPRPRAPEDFTFRTLTEIERQDVEGGKLGSAIGESARKALRGLIWAIGSAIAFGIGYAIMQWFWPNPSARLARDLPIAEHLDEYRDVNTYDFLKELVDSPEFNADRD
jgi:ferric-dicitrate binding protein FerR (iron transport regulator)